MLFLRHLVLRHLNFAIFLNREIREINLLRKFHVILGTLKNNNLLIYITTIIKVPMK